MATITTRAGKGSPLTNTELDNNFTNLNTAKYESGSSVSFSHLVIPGSTYSAALGGNALTFDRDGGSYIDQSSNTGELIFRFGSTYDQRLNIGSAQVVFNEESDDVDFRIESNSNASAFRLDGDTGNIGVGTTPHSSMKLLVYENSDKEATIKVENESTTANAVAALRLESTGNNFAIMNYPDAGTEDNTTRFISTASGSSFKFATGAADRFTIHSNGRVDLNGPDYTYASADSNYHIKLEENNHHAYISNINGTMFLGSGGRYYGGNLRSLDTGVTAYAAISISNFVGFSLYGSTGHTAGQVNASTLLHHRLETTTGAAMFNDTGASTGDFRVESDSNGSMFFVDASQNTVNVNNSAAYASNTFLVNQTSDARGIALAYTGRGNSRVEFQLSGVNNEGATFLHNDHTDRKQLFHMSRTNVVVNDEGLDMDFRVESDGDAHMLFVDAGTDRVGVGAATPYKTLEVEGDTQLDATNASLWLKSGAAGTHGYVNWTFNTDDIVYAKAGIDYDTRASTGFHIDSGYPITIDYSHSGSDGLTFAEGGTTTHRFNNAGAIFNEGSSGSLDFRVESDSNAYMLFADAGNNSVSIGSSGIGQADTFIVNNNASLNGNDTFLAQFNDGSNDGWNGGVLISSYQPRLALQDTSGGGNFYDMRVDATALKFSRGSKDTMFARTHDAIFELNPNEAVFNQNSHNRDFRVESDTNSNGLFFDASANALGINKQPDANGYYALDINGVIRQNGSTVAGIVLPYGTTKSLAVGTGNLWYKVYAVNSATARNLRFEITTSGDNTVSKNHFAIDISGYSFKHSINLTNYSYYNQTRLLAVATRTNNNTTLEVWVKLRGNTSSAGSLTVRNDQGSLNSSIVGQSTEPTSLNALMTSSAWPSDSNRTSAGFSNGVTIQNGKKLTLADSANTASNSLSADSGGLVVNEGSGNTDFRVESDSNAYMLVVDASANNVIIGNNAASNPNGLFQVGSGVGGNVFNGTTAVISNPTSMGSASGSSYKILQLAQDTGNSTALTFKSIRESTGSTFVTSAFEITLDVDHTDNVRRYQKFSYPNGVVINDSGHDAIDFRVESDSNTHALFVDAGANNVEINVPLRMITYTGYGADTNKIIDMGASNYTSVDTNRISKYTLKTSGNQSGQDFNIYGTRRTGAASSVDHSIFKIAGYNGTTVINEDGYPDADFRVETNSFANAFVVSDDTVKIATGTNSGTGGWTFYPTGSGGMPYVIQNKTAGGTTRAWAWQVSGVTKGSIDWGDTGTTYSTTSDRRLKDNIEPIADGTAKLMAMKPVTYTWIADPEADAVHGFIAQEMQEIVPEAVTGEPDGEEMMSMDYGRITPVLVAALQEATNEIKALKERVAELEEHL